MVQPFSIDSSMRAVLGGAFYPTGYSFIMFPDEATAQTVGEQLLTELDDVDEVFLASPQAILTQISPTVAGSDDPLPSAGTEGATVRAYTSLARQGHGGLLVRTPDKEIAEHVMEIVAQHPYSMAQRYRALVIEDL
ncbi:hypothetical protein QTI66_00725 [Variovorax sp. J22R133]|uniref:hypothetical protein n=1 Tax=Variovorax brevis TaxID=3053503 RepID=UPI002577961B|nr:hypothetical protein [Variovorax sp. J22R133]MDM0110648.1 hypothetical protein [Variovorax sp. J22R133]